MNHTRIEAWWKDPRATIPITVHKLQQWLCWWAKKLTHLAYYSMNELEFEEEALVPTTNLVENVHSSPCGFLWEMVRQFDLIDLYITTMDAVVRSVFQQQFYHMFLFGNKAST